MESPFVNIEAEKQEMILNAAMRVFVENGYKNASTNTIVKEAGISKGLLFYYFKNKKQLFLFLYDYCVEKIVTEFYEQVDLRERDFFARLRQMIGVKFELVNKHPEIFAFFEVAYLENAAEVKSEMDERNAKLAERTSLNLMEDIEMSKFKKEIDFPHMFKVVTWTLEGLGNEEMKKAKYFPGTKIDYEAVMATCDTYLHLLKGYFYKEWVE